MHDAPALAVFDWAVHSGRSIAVRQLQRALEIEPDGLIGKDTLTAMQKRDPVELAVALTMARARHQGKLVLANTALARFVGGWGARLVDLTATVSRMV
jgi:lysozyme family protein